MRWILALICCTCLLSCQKQNQWSHAKIHSNYRDFAYSKVTYRTKDPIHGVDLEFTHVPDQLKAFIIIHSTPVFASAANPKKVKVKIELEGQIHEFEADRLEGGQRLLLPEAITEMLLAAFQAKKNVLISIPGYRSIVEGEGFKEHFHKMKPSFMENPFHLPF